MSYQSLKAERANQEYQIQIAKQARELCFKGEFEAAWKIESKVIAKGFCKKRYMEIARKRQLENIQEQMQKDAVNFQISQYG